MSLGGKSKGKAQESKQDFLERTRKEREDREQARRRERAALRIQVERLSDSELLCYISLYTLPDSVGMIPKCWVYSMRRALFGAGKFFTTYESQKGAIGMTS